MDFKDILEVVGVDGLETECDDGIKGISTDGLGVSLLPTFVSKASSRLKDFFIFD